MAPDPWTEQAVQMLDTIPRMIFQIHSDLRDFSQKSAPPRLGSVML